MTDRRPYDDDLDLLAAHRRRIFRNAYRDLGLPIPNDLQPTPDEIRDALIAASRAIANAWARMASATDSALRPFAQIARQLDDAGLIQFRRDE